MEVSEQTDAQRWDQRLREGGGHPLQAWAWGSLKEQFGWQAHRLWIDDGRAAAQLLIRPYRGLAAAYVPRGPLLSGDSRLDGALIEAVGRLARSHRAAFLRLEPDILDADEPGSAALQVALAGGRFRRTERTLQPRSSIRLDLNRSDDELLAGFSKGHRADVRRAEREGVQVRVAATERDVDLLHEMMRATQQRKGFGIHSPGYYRALWRFFGDDAHLLLAERDSTVVAAALIIAFGRQAIYLAAGSTRAGLDARASHALQWHAMRWARDRGAATYDLWGIPDARGRLALAVEGGGEVDEKLRRRLEAEAAHDPLDGVYRFKKGWGGRVVRSAPAHDRVFFAPAYWFWRWRRSEA
jgi:lipid II:glycine glycyltransferase (peptidoglycan interpeptide bridge formation enzyme)